MKNESECRWNHLPICPYCGAEQTDTADCYEDGSMCCDSCDRDFYVSIEQNPQYSTSPICSTEDKHYGLIAVGQTKNWTNYFFWLNRYAQRHWKTEGWERRAFIATGYGSFRFQVLVDADEVAE